MFELRKYFLITKCIAISFFAYQNLISYNSTLLWILQNKNTLLMYFKYIKHTMILHMHMGHLIFILFHTYSKCTEWARKTTTNSQNEQQQHIKPNCSSFKTVKRSQQGILFLFETLFSALPKMITFEQKFKEGS